MPTKCPHCGKQFKTAASFGRHFTICHALANAHKKTEILDSLQLTNLMRKLIKDNDALKKKVAELEKRALPTRKNINIIKWMNKNMIEGKHFKEWIDGITVDNKALKYVLDVGFNKGVINIILNTCKDEWNNEHIPIRCFNELSGIYVFDSKEWRVIKDNEFKEIICLIQRKLFIEYKTLEDKMDVYDCNKNDKYLKDMRILCGDGKLESNTNIIKKKFYSEIKLSGRKLVYQTY